MSATAGTPPGLSWPNTQSQGPPMAENNGENEDGVSTRPMRLKVLYTFDDQNKTNCLARWPHVLQIQTVAMDETTTIGVVELKTCINAIVQCSPELVARLGQDYTVYAYDYSEYDNPLVGQGMLSWALAAASPTPDAPAHQSRQLITGRVCKNIMGLFTNGVKETLEVKLRLVPVPTVLQSQYINTMEKYRELSKVMPPGFDPNEWTSFLQSNPNIGQIANQPSPTPQLQPSTNQRDGVSMELVNQLLSPSLQQQTMADSFVHAKNPEIPGNDGQTNTTTNGKGKANSRPSSRASVKRPRARKPKASQSAGGNTSGYEEGTDGDDGPAPKKRAKVTKADWNSNTSLGTAPDSLRVAASTAGSLRLFRPIAISSNPPPGAGHIQEMPRAPTPVPMQPTTKPMRDTMPPQSSLRRDSFTQLNSTSQPHISPYPPLGGSEDQVLTSIESAHASPERNISPGATPLEIGSSPPLMRTRPGTPMRSSPPCASSPVLPQMPRTDSGFMSGSLDELFGDEEEIICPGNDDEVDLVPTFEGAQLAQEQQTPVSQPYPEFNIEEVMPGPVELLPTRMPIIDPSRQAESWARAKSAMSRAGSVMSEDGQVLPPLKKTNRAASRSGSMSRPDRATPPQQQPPRLSAGPPQITDYRPAEPQKSVSQPPELQQTQNQPALPGQAPNSRPASRMMARTASLGSLTFPQIPASDPTLPPSTLQRSQTWTEAPHPATEAPMPPGDVFYRPPLEEAQSSRPTAPFSRTMQAKRESIRNKLETAIAKGEMPPFCSNCGAIKTPTWRKAWSKTMMGKPAYYEYSDEPGRVTAITILTRDGEGEPTSYQLIKKFLLPEENVDDFTEFILCNPCGIWMSKYKTHRPENRWENNGPQERSKGGERKRPQQRPKSKKTQAATFAVLTSEANFPQSEAYFPPSDANFPQSEAYHPQGDGMGPPESISPGDTTGTTQNQQLQGATIEDQRKRSGSGRPKKRLNAMTSDAASVALRRAIQSSPARWAGTQHSPIEVEGDDLGSTRRLLFPSPRKDGSPKVLGEVVTNVVTIATDFRSPKEGIVETQNKENCPPAIDADDMDAELLKLFEEELAKGDDARPTTPTQKSPVANPFKTPTRPTPSHRPVTRSVSRSIRSGKSPGQLLTFNRTPSRTPGTAGRRRSPRNHDPVFDSPFTATLNQMMSEANNQTSPVRQGLELDFSNLPNLPDLPNMGQNHSFDMNFSIEDLFSTDVPMPSSPPRFHLYEDPLTRGGGSNINWDDFGRLAPDDEVKVKEEPEESPRKLGDDKDADKEKSA
ncbi:hypothetical protein EG329_005396 [Mollisiaceae sp. DMI_Dod_QoI]|nr:hypothetical protein EG329_005396 [Helotiales sp. DMI_Dod_QoI]